MRSKAIVSLCFAIVVVVAAISIPGTEIEFRAARLEACEHSGLQLTALFNSAVAQEQAHNNLCEGGVDESINQGTIANSPVINLHQNLDQMYITGEGLTASGHVDIDIHLMAGGIVSPAYSLNIHSQDETTFTSDATTVSCDGSKDRLYVLVRDIHGNEHARIFEPGEFRCTSR